MHPVTGRRGQTYLLCRNKTIDVKYPRQPVKNCPGHASAHPGDRAPSSAPAIGKARVWVDDGGSTRA